MKKMKIGYLIRVRPDLEDIIPGDVDGVRIQVGDDGLYSDEDLAKAAEVRGKQPKVGIEVAVDEAFLHCAKAFKRSKLWDPNAQQDRSEMPSLARMILEQTAPPEEPPSEDDVKDADEFVEDNYRKELY